MDKNEAGGILVNYYTVGFTTTKGLCIDLDNITEKKAKKLIEYLLNKHKLQGYLLLKSSKNHYHVVFNRYLTWKKTLQILVGIYICRMWMLWQIKKGEITLRISTKNGKNKPQIIYTKGKTDKLINDYLQIYKQFEEY